MKICFLLQRRFAYIGHELAQILKEKHNISEFCGYVYLRSSFNFLKSQTDIKYTKLLLDQDIHRNYKTEQLDKKFLNYLEQNYGLPNLWPYVYLDRIIRYNQHVREYPYDTPSYSHEEMLQIIQVKARAIIKFLDEEKPDVAFFSVIAAAGSLLLYEIAKKKGIKTLVLYPARVGERQTLSQEYGASTYAVDVFKKLQNNQDIDASHRLAAEEFLKNFKRNPLPYTKIDTPKIMPVNRQRQFKFLWPKEMVRGISWTATLFKNYIMNPYRNDYENSKPWHYLWDKAKRKIRILIGYDSLYDDMDFNEDYAFFPLQVQPEKSTMLYAPFYTDQVWLAKLIAQSLPASYKLYIKEHPTMFGFRNHGFYKELKKIPNVKLIKPTITSHEVIKHTKLTITTTGTAGWESVLLQKPTITFGKVFYNELSMVKRCITPEMLPFIIQKQLKNTMPDKRELINFIAALHKESVPVDIIKLWKIEGATNLDKKRDQLEPLADYIASKLKTIAE